MASGPVDVQQVPATRGTFRSGVDVVEIDVTVTGRDGAPIDGLADVDFVVRVDGQPRRVVSARRQRASDRIAGTPSPRESPPSAPPGADAPEYAGRTFVLVVDRDGIESGFGRSHLEAAVRFVDRLAPDDRVALWTLPVVGPALRVIRDRQALKKEIRNALGTARPFPECVRMTAEEAFQIDVVGDKRVKDDVYARECTTKACALTECSRGVEAIARRRSLEYASRQQQSLQALDRLIGLLGALDGAKHVVLITGGNYLRPTDRSIVAAVGERAALARIYVHALQVWNPPGLAGAEERGHASRPVEDQNATAELALASMTGGVALTTLGGDGAFKILERQASAWYVVAIEAEPAERDGRPHEIAVALASRKGLAVRARSRFVIELPAPPSTAADSDPPVTTTGDTVSPEAPHVEAPAEVESLVASLGAQVERFERESAGLVAEERYVQVVRHWRGVPRLPADDPALEWTGGAPSDRARRGTSARRELRSDVLLVSIPGERWVGFRDVADVDGRAVRDRVERVQRLFLSPDADRDAQLARIADESARYNLGTARRNLNIPTVSLYLLHPQHQARFEFRRAGDETIAGARTRVLRFRERTRPTLIGTPRGGDIPIDGRAWIDVQTGRLVQTEVRLEAASFMQSGIVTRYRASDDGSGIVPEFMWEWYQGSGMRMGQGQSVHDSGLSRGGDLVAGASIVDANSVTECLARYANVRRFVVQTSEVVR
jgi:VWFA-related protein